MVKLILFVVTLATLLSQNTDGLSRVAPECSGSAFDLWRVGCNWCQCENGRPVCDGETCSREELAWARCTGECIGRGSWKKDCNRCSCRRGTAVCTKRYCPPSGPVCSELDRAKCPEYRMIDYMQVKGCKPVYPRRGGCCATHFKCNEDLEKPSEAQCLYKGKVVAKSTRLPKSVGCLFGCFCAGPRFICAIPGCAYIKLEDGCYLTQKLNGCCPSGFKCEKDNPAQCKWDGKTYLEGQRMSFDQPEYSCQNCICSKDFKNPFAGPQCEKIDCAFDLSGNRQSQILKGCVPVFSGNRCCPFEFLCPGDEKTDTPQDDAVERPRGRVCKFGGFNIPVGKELKTTDEQVTCRCVAPPDVLCVRNSESIRIA